MPKFSKRKYPKLLPILLLIVVLFGLFLVKNNFFLLKEYENKQFNFAFSYPASYSLEEGDLLSPENGIYISLRKDFPILEVVDGPRRSGHNIAIQVYTQQNTLHTPQIPDSTFLDLGNGMLEIGHDMGFNRAKESQYNAEFEQIRRSIHKIK